MFILKLDDPSEVNMSLSLFNHLKNSLNATNKMLRGKKLILRNKRLFVPGEVLERTKISTHSTSSETWEDGQGNSVDLGMWGVTVRLNHESTTLMLWGEGAVAAGIAAMPGGVTTIVGGILGAAIAGQATYYGNYGNNGGVTVFIPYTALIPGTPPIGVTYTLNNSGNH